MDCRSLMNGSPLVKTFYFAWEYLKIYRVRKCRCDSAFLPPNCEKRAVRAEICVPALALERGDIIIITFNAEKV